MRCFISTVFFLLVMSGYFMQVNGQIVTTDPPIPLADEPVTVYFDATGTGLDGYTGIVYAHTGITIGTNKWQNVIGTWPNNNTQPQLTTISPNYHKLEISPSIRVFYNASPSANITEMCFVFRSADGSQQTVPDIFIPVFEQTLNVNLISPSVSPFFVDPGEDIEVYAEAIMHETISLFVDDVLIATSTGSSISETITAGTEPDTKSWIKVVAQSGNSQAADSNYFYIRGATMISPLPPGLKDGINYTGETTATLVLHAPYKTSVYVMGDFSDWQIGPEYKLQQTVANQNDINTRYWVSISGLTPGVEYAFQYLIDEELRVTDPYTHKILDSWNDPYITDQTYPNLKDYPYFKTTGIVGILQTGQEEYPWQVTNFAAPQPKDLVIYELLLRDFLHAHDFSTLKDTISYLKQLGINAIELMPVNEFEGNLSWGYNPSFYFAVDKYYGPRNTFKAFIDECHANGIAVIMDMVLNHAYGQNVMVQMYWDEVNSRPAANNPWFNPLCPHEPYCWGNDFNHESQATKDFIDRVNHYWLTEYKIDGFRFDFTKGFTNSNSGSNYDPDRIAIIKRMADKVWETNPDAYVILEHFTDNSEEKELANYGCLIWGNMNYNYNEATMGYHDGGKSDFSWISYKKRGWNDPHLVGYMESHDEERLMAKNLNYGNSSGNYNIQDLSTAIKRQELAGVFYFTIPGPKMIWQFGELAYDYHINYPGLIGGNDNRLTEKPIRWDYFEEYQRKLLYDVYSAMIHLKMTEPAFSTTDFTLSVAPALKKIHLNHNTMNVTIIGNFGVTQGSVVPDFQHTGYWYNYFTGDSIMVENVNATLTLEAGEYRIYTDKKLETPQVGMGIGSNDTNPATIERVYPNPSSGEFYLELFIARKTHVVARVIDSKGAIVSLLLSEVLSPGNHTLKWDASDRMGNKQGRGIYFIELVTADSRRVHKINLF
jgi:1,4-alpha-glucan branching enzyme